MELKIAFLIIVAGVSNVLANPGYSQVAKVSLDFENKRLEQVMDEIERQSEFYFIFNQKQIDVNRIVDIQVENKLITDILLELFSGTNVNYAVLDRKILLTTDPLENSLLAIASVTEPQQNRITGTVTETDGTPIPGVNVVVTGTTLGTITDIAGKYSIEVPQGSKSLIFSFIGMEQQEIIIGTLTQINATMAKSAIGLGEVVVVGYGTQKKINLTGAVTQVKMAEILGSRPVSNVALALEGSIPGLQITTNSGRPGQESSINIRGIMSFSGGSPLILVDNVPMSIYELNPTDIESVSVLKDASASSIYGGRAAFGVILITTKKGEKNEPIKFNYSNNFSISQPSDLPKKASTLETITALKAFGNTTYVRGQDLDTWESLLTEYHADPSLYPEGETMVNGVRYRLAEDDLYKKFMTNSFEQMHNLSFSGGSEKSSYRVSFGYADEDGIMITNKDSYKKFNVNAYLSSAITKRLTSSINILYKNDIRLTPAEYNILFYYGMSWPLHSNSGYYVYPDGSTIPFSSPNNVLKLEPADRSLGGDLRIFNKLNYDLFDGFKLIGEYTFATSNDENFSTRTKNIYMRSDTYNEEYRNAASSYSRSSSSNYNHALNLYGRFEKEINEHNLQVLLGTNQELSLISSYSTTRRDLLSIEYPSLATATGTMTNGESFNDYAISGYFGRINYSYKNKYLIEATSRYDGSSKFPKKSRFGFFPSFSAGWVVSKEAFMKPIERIVSLLKLRGSWGEIGNQAIPSYMFIPGMNSGNASWVDPSTNIKVLTIYPPNLVSISFTWETVRTKNIGSDLGLFKNRLNASFDYFNRETLNMLGKGAELPAVLGTLAPQKNVADLVSKGWEASLVWKDSKKDFSYSFGINVSDNRAFVTKFDNKGGLLSQYYKGYEFGEIWGYETYGYYTVDDFVPGTLDANLMNGTLKEGIPAFYTVIKTNPGDIRFVDLNGDGKISPGTSTLSDPGDRKIIGNSKLHYQLGITGNVQYKNFDFSFLIQGIGKSDMWINTELFWPYNSTFACFYKNQLDYWTPENTDAFYPRSYIAAGGNTPTSRNVQTKYLSNGAYLRVKNIELGYTLPKLFLNKLSVSNARVFISGENLLMLDHLPHGMDTQIANVSGGSGYPFIRKISFGVNVSF